MAVSKLIASALKQEPTLIKRNVIASIVIDSTGTTEPKTIVELNEEHKKQGSIMFNHHYYIRKNGYIYQGRFETFIGNFDPKFNNTGIGILLEGDFDIEEVTDLQFNSLIMIIKDIRSRNKYIGESIYTHSELNSEYASSPGNLFPYILFRNRLLDNFTYNNTTFNNVKKKVIYEFGVRNLEMRYPLVKGTDVYELKMKLKSLGYEFTNMNDIYNEETMLNVKRFQIKYKLNPMDGIARPNVYAKIKELLNIDHFDKSKMFRRSLYYNQNAMLFGSDVKTIKEKLFLLGFLDDLGQDNLFDKAMEDAVKAFQLSKLITINGIVNYLTYLTIVKCEDYSFRRTLKYEEGEPLMVGNDVIAVQKSLSRKGYLSVQYITGEYDVNSMEAVKKYQIDNDLTDDGEVGEKLFNMIMK